MEESEIRQGAEGFYSPFREPQNRAPLQNEKGGGPGDPSDQWGGGGVVGPWWGQ